MKKLLVNGELVRELGPEDSVTITADQETPKPGPGAEPGPGAGPEPPASEYLIYNWTPNSAGAQQVDWNEYRDKLKPHGGTGRRRGGGPNPHMMMSNGHRLFCHLNQEVPEMAADGTLVSRRHADMFNTHNLLVPRGVGEAWNTFYLRPRRDIEFRFALTFDTTEFASHKWLDHDSNPWLLVWELWSLNLDGGVPLQIMFSQEGDTSHNAFVSNVRGSNQSQPTEYTDLDTEILPTPMFDEPNEFIVQLRLDHTGETAYYRLWLNGLLVHELPVGTQPIGINKGFDSGKIVPGAMYCQWGLYSSKGTEPGAIVRCHGMRIWDTTNAPNETLDEP